MVPESLRKPIVMVLHSLAKLLSIVIATNSLVHKQYILARNVRTNLAVDLGCPDHTYHRRISRHTAWLCFMVG